MRLKVEQLLRRFRLLFLERKVNDEDTLCLSLDTYICDRVKVVFDTGLLQLTLFLRLTLDQPLFGLLLLLFCPFL